MRAVATSRKTELEMPAPFGGGPAPARTELLAAPYAAPEELAADLATIASSLAAGGAAQKTGLVLRPGQDITVVEIVLHGTNLART